MQMVLKSVFGDKTILPGYTCTHTTFTLKCPEFMCLASPFFCVCVDDDCSLHSLALIACLILNNLATPIIYLPTELIARCRYKFVSAIIVFI